MLRIAAKPFSIFCLLVLTMMNLGADRAKMASRSEPDQKQTHHVMAAATALPGELMQNDNVVPVTRAEPVKRQFWMEVTAYCPCQRCCGPAAHGVTASGLPVSHNAGRFVAADTRVLPFGSKVAIPGYHQNTDVPVIDRGGAIKGNKLDVFFPTHEEALQWGRRMVLVAVDTD